MAGKGYFLSLDLNFGVFVHLAENKILRVAIAGRSEIVSRADIDDQHLGVALSLGVGLCIVIFTSTAAIKLTISCEAMMYADSMRNPPLRSLLMLTNYTGA